MNLTAVTDRVQVYDRLVEDSLSLTTVLQEALPLATTESGRRRQMIDIGSGNGNPGILLAIARPGALHTCPCLRAKEALTC